jgi:hypothetical protein
MTDRQTDRQTDSCSVVSGNHPITSNNHTPAPNNQIASENHRIASYNHPAVPKLHYTHNKRPDQLGDTRTQQAALKQYYLLQNCPELKSVIRQRPGTSPWDPDAFWENQTVYGSPSPYRNDTHQPTNQTQATNQPTNQPTNKPTQTTNQINQTNQQTNTINQSTKPNKHTKSTS